MHTCPSMTLIHNPMRPHYKDLIFNLVYNMIDIFPKRSLIPRGIYFMGDLTVLVGVWAQLECGTLLPEEFAKKFGEVLQSMTQQRVNMSELLPGIQTSMIEPYPEVLTAIQCIKAEGLKTALVTNNWLMEEEKSFCPVDVIHFDVVSIPRFVFHF